MAAKSRFPGSASNKNSGTNLLDTNIGVVTMTVRKTVDEVVCFSGETYLAPIF